VKYLLTVVIVLAVLILGALLYVWSGSYDIAATEPHWSITLSLIDTLKDRSIEVRSKDIHPPNLEDPKLKELAFPHYHEMCRLCHGAPGYLPEEFAPGLYPSPPNMTKGDIQKELSDAEIYWILKHGIKMTGMPAFGPTHKDEILWGLVALVKEIPRMSPEQYQRQVTEMGLEEETAQGREHHHEPVVEKDHGHMEAEPSAQEETEQDHQ
jgi:hypothetical protein